ncbi:hypothetical protein VTI74DRAFT_6262 [Chaetomium olivicolor]
MRLRAGEQEAFTAEGMEANLLLVAAPRQLLAASCQDHTVGSVARLGWGASPPSRARPCIGRRLPTSRASHHAHHTSRSMQILSPAQPCCRPSPLSLVFPCFSQNQGFCPSRIASLQLVVMRDGEGGERALDIKGGPPEAHGWEPLLVPCPPDLDPHKHYQRYQ